MKQNVFLLLLIPGLCTLCSCLSRQYHFVNVMMTWAEAQSYCRQNYTDLATIDSTEEVKALVEVTDSEYNSAWIGLQRAESASWRWSLEDTSFYSEGGAGFRNWENEEPNDPSKPCAAMKNNNGKWKDVQCQENKSFVCYDGGSLTHKYFLIEQQRNWSEAQVYCRERHTDLVSVRNQAENQEVQRMTHSPQQDVWIGLFRDPWKWSDQSKSTLRFWNDVQPDNAEGDENCVVMWKQHSGRWGDVKCDKRFPFFCYDDELILVPENKSWNEALSYCRQHYVDLVSVSTEQLQHWVERRAQAASTPYVWLGLRYTCVLHFWFWVSGEGVCYQNWAPGNSTGECRHTGAIEFGGGHQWVSLPETEELNFICSKKHWGESGTTAP
ncbi:macrophage mannose receptor 1-like [Megalops cyprinoides]|uniref:macrophage mannose receptor 1-like n=1 Tax=Megalops cyprinoides TaxID=118141 RepID=UPI001864BD30|nr:macrophage mannose receptor 1-like [Megalops cyprinoides]